MELTSPTVDKTDLVLEAGQTRRFWNTWSISYEGLRPHRTDGTGTLPGGSAQPHAWIADLTIGTLIDDTVRVTPTLTVRSGEDAPGSFGGFLDQAAAADIAPTEPVAFHALIGTRSADGIVLTLDLGLPGQPRITLTTPENPKP
ncbi:hypothetical protein EDD29_4846 [Actinocorallia herbida]|uniref:Uncharacterized protein n=1 Tax=Actinocorallia herbida TaxID=58109 RepID=A0A3N1D155_9ACTN|nr:hypothetical protein EDD29_4846 [Actinocorallia herbida]